MISWSALIRLLPFARLGEDEPDSKPAPQPDRPPQETPVPNPDPECPECGGTLKVRAKDANGRDIEVPCPRCLPNDAPGG